MLGLDTASFTADGSGDSDFVNSRTTTVALVVASSLPLSPTGFADIRLPLGLQRRGEFILGNIMLGGHGISRVGKRVWLIGGGQFGLPTFSSNSQRPSEIGESPLVGRIGWDAQEYAPDMIPFMGTFAVEAHFGEDGLVRADIAPIIGMQIGDANDGVFFIFQHSVEIQYGHDLGVGLRMQGLAPVDGYQLAVEPFFVWESERNFLRAGMMLPMTAPFGPPITGSWGARIALGTRL